MELKGKATRMQIDQRISREYTRKIKLLSDEDVKTVLQIKLSNFQGNVFFKIFFYFFI